MPPTEADGGPDPLDAHLRDLTDHQRAVDAAAARRREHWLRQQATEEGHLAGVLLDLGERDRPVAVATVGGRTLRGVIATVGADFVGLRGPGGEATLIPLPAIAGVRAEPRARSTVGDRPVVVRRTLGTTLDDLAADRVQVLLHTAGGGGVAGELQRAGTDLLRVRTSAGDTTYVPLAAITDVVLP